MLHPLRMRARADVLRLERGRERDDGLLVGPLDEQALAALQLEQVPEVAGVEQELFLGLPDLLRPERDAVQAAGQAFHDRKKLERAERLADECVRARLFRRSLRSGLAAAEQHDGNPRGAWLGLEPGAQLEPVDARHGDVEDDRVRHVRVDRFARGRRVMRLFDVDRNRFERRADEGSKPGIVVDKQQSQKVPLSSSDASKRYRPVRALSLVIQYE